MVYRGKPSAGCEQCRKAKKRCGLERPSCARCMKLKKPCSGYRDTTALQIQDESESVRQKVDRHRARASAPSHHVFVAEKPSKLDTELAAPAELSVQTPISETSVSSGETREIVRDDYGQLILFNDQEVNDAPVWDSSSSGVTIFDGLKLSADDVATTYFFNHFTANQGHWNHLRQMARTSKIDPVLDLAVRACGMAALNNVEGVIMGREYSAMLYGEALALLNSALRDPKRSKTDDSLLAVSMLGYYENLTCDSRQSIQSWKAHILGATQLIKIRGKNQFKTHIGRALYREIRAQILTQCMWDDQEPPAFIRDLEKELDDVTLPADPSAPVDHLTRITFGFAVLRFKLRQQSITDKDALEQMAQIEMGMVQWSIDTKNAHPLWRYHEVEVHDSPHVWNSLVHSYSYHIAASAWNTYRSMRIMMSRVQEMLYRRLTSSIQQDDAQIAYFQSVRRQMTDEICYGMPTQLGHAAPAFNSPCIFVTAYSSVWPLFFAGTCTLERIGTAYFGNGAPSITSVASAQTTWIIGRMDYISKHIGLKWIDGIVATLKGDFEMHGDIMEEEDMDYIRYYWRNRREREKKISLKEEEREPGRIESSSMPAWLQKIQNSGKGPRVLLEKESDGVPEPRAGTVWLGRALGSKNGPFPKLAEKATQEQLVGNVHNRTEDGV